MPASRDVSLQLVGCLAILRAEAEELADACEALEPFLSAGLPVSYIVPTSGATNDDIQRSDVVRRQFARRTEQSSCNLAYHFDRFLLALRRLSVATSGALGIIREVRRQDEAPAVEGGRAWDLEPLDELILAELNPMNMWPAPAPNGRSSDLPSALRLQIWSASLREAAFSIGEWELAINRPRCSRASLENPQPETQTQDASQVGTEMKAQKGADATANCSVPVEEQITQAVEFATKLILQRGSNGIGGQPNKWKGIQRRLLVKVDQGEPYIAGRKLAKELGCKEPMIRKAIKFSETLKAWKRSGSGRKAAPKARDIVSIDEAELRQSREPPPDEIILDDEVEVVLRGLIERAGPAERSRLNALDSDERRALAAVYQSQVKDDEGSSVAPDLPGAKPQKVIRRKRA